MIKHFARSLTPAVLAVACSLALCGCLYDSPITAHPTNKADERFLGHWTSQDGRTKMQVGKYDEYNYVLEYDGQLYHAWESAVAGTPFFSVQSLDSTQDGVYKFTYSSWKLAPDGTLHGRAVNDKIIADGAKSSAAVQKLLKDNSQNPDLLGDEIVFVKDK